jgi:hypothetical protein
VADRDGSHWSGVVEELAEACARDDGRYALLSGCVIMMFSERSGPTCSIAEGIGQRCICSAAAVFRARLWWRSGGGRWQAAGCRLPLNLSKFCARNGGDLAGTVCRRASDGP